MSNPILDSKDKKIKWQCKEIDISFEQYPTDSGGYDFTDGYVTIDGKEHRLVFNLECDADYEAISIYEILSQPYKDYYGEYSYSKDLISGEYKNNSIFRKEFVVKIGENDTIFKDYKKLTFIGTEIE